jgi:hypothetical protein
VSVVETKTVAAQGLRRGERVRLRSLAEIEASLDEQGRTKLLPFMREMLAYRGRILEVASRADKTCDTINLVGCTRQMSDTVHLTGARCDGSAHGGCQALCLLFFKESWLERVPEGEDAAYDVGAEAARADVLGERLDAYAHAAPDHYRCQATQLLDATTPLKGVGHYVKDIQTRNVPWRKFAKGIAKAAVNRYQTLSEYHLPPRFRFKDGHRLPDMRGAVRDGRWPDQPVELRPGDLVEVRSRGEIRETLDENQRNRGLWFDEEMTALCGQRGRILYRVERLIDERTGRMLTIKKDLYIVAGMLACEGLYHKLCTRSVMAMMRASWLRRLE